MKRENIARIIIGTFFLLFLALYFTQATGYHEYEQRKRTTFTEEEIKRFEQDVKDGKNIDMETYLDRDEHNYENKLSNLGLSLSRKIEEAMNQGIEYLFRSINKVIEEK